MLVNTTRIWSDFYFLLYAFLSFSEFSTIDMYPLLEGKMGFISVFVPKETFFIYCFFKSPLILKD